MRPRVLLPLLLGLVVLVSGSRPAVVVLRSVHPTADASTTPKPNWLPADKQAFGTSRTLASKVWFTLEGGEPSEVYYPTLDTPSFRTPTFSATPLAWTHAQFIRLAWSIAAGRPVEQPAVVACRYVRTCAAP